MPGVFMIMQLSRIEVERNKKGIRQFIVLSMLISLIFTFCLSWNTDMRKVQFLFFYCWSG